MSVNHGAEVEGKVHRLCQEFGNIHRGTVKQIFLLCNRDEEHCRRMLQTFRDSPSGHPNAPGRQFSAPSSSMASEEAVDIPLQPAHKLSPQTSQSVPPPQPMQSSPSQHHPAATINLTLDDIMRLLRMTSDPYTSRQMTYHQLQQPRFTTQMEFGRAGTMSRGHFTPPAPHPSDHRPSTLSPVQRDISKILEAQQRQIAEMKQALSDVKKDLSSLEQVAEEKHESLNKNGLRILQGIQDSTLEEKQILIQTLHEDIVNLSAKKNELEAAADQLKPRTSGTDGSNSTPNIWRCQYCTFDNDVGLDECRMCHFKRGTKPKAF